MLERKIRYCSLPELVREQFLWAARSIVVAGTHGKTTTTSLVGWLLTAAGRDPERARRRHRRQLRRRLPPRRRPRVRHRRRRVRQRLLRQDGEVPQVPARHRDRQQHRVRSRRHLSGRRRGRARVQAPRGAGAAQRPAPARRRQPARRGAGGARGQPGRDVRRRGDPTWKATDVDVSARRHAFKVHKHGTPDRHLRRAAPRRAQRQERARRHRRLRHARHRPSRHGRGLPQPSPASSAAWSCAARSTASRSTTTSRIIRPRWPKRSPPCAAPTRSGASGRSSSRARPRRA